MSNFWHYKKCMGYCLGSERYFVLPFSSIGFQIILRRFQIWKVRTKKIEYSKNDSTIHKEKITTENRFSVHFQSFQFFQLGFPLISNAKYWKWTVKENLRMIVLFPSRGSLGSLALFCVWETGTEKNVPSFFWVLSVFQ